MANKKTRKRKVSTVKKSVIKQLLEEAPYLPAPSYPAEPYVTRVGEFRVKYYEWLQNLQQTAA